jgi:four helix bundle protein
MAYAPPERMARDLDDRVFRFACRIVEIFRVLYDRPGAGRAISHQFLRAGTSVAANYAEAAAGQTKPDFIAKLSIARKELYETRFWLRLIVATGQVEADHLAADSHEVNELISIVTAIIKKAKASPERGQ